MKNENEPAFPLVELVSPDRDVYYGLTKREYFAGLAMQGMLAKGVDTVLIKPVAIDAVRYADALLAELERKEL